MAADCMLSVCSHHLGEIGLLLLLWESAVLTHLVCLHKGQYLDAISNWIEFVTVANGALRCAAWVFPNEAFSQI